MISQGQMKCKCCECAAQLSVKIFLTDARLTELLFVTRITLMEFEFSVIYEYSFIQGRQGR